MMDRSRNLKPDLTLRHGGALSTQISEIRLIRTQQAVRLEVTRNRGGMFNSLVETIDLHFIQSGDSPDFDPDLPLPLLEQMLVRLDEVSLLNCTTLLTDINFVRTKSRQ